MCYAVCCMLTSAQQATLAVTDELLDPLLLYDQVGDGLVGHCSVEVGVLEGVPCIRQGEPVCMCVCMLCVCVCMLCVYVCYVCMYVMCVCMYVCIGFSRVSPASARANLVASAVNSSQHSSSMRKLPLLLD
jgi:hypothetical protein